jgi:Putative MetA-pathway of phenol degradation
MRRGRIGVGYAASGAMLGLTLLLLAAPPPATGQLFIDPTFTEARKALIGGLANNVGTLPSPSGGSLTFQLDPTLGVFTRDSDTLGPIFTDRYQTTGRNRLTVTASYTRHTFDEVDGLDVRKDGIDVLIVGVGRLNQVNVREEADADVWSLGAIYGITDNLDIGLTIPIVRVKLKESATRTAFIDCVNPVLRLGCDPNSVQIRNDPLLTSQSESTGIGDIALRGKYNFWSGAVGGGRLGSAALLEVKMPTGDTGDRRALRNPGIRVGPSGTPADTRFTLGDPPLGTGIFRVKPELIVSGEWNPGGVIAIGPHVNVGAELGTTEGITNDLVYAVGVDLAPQLAFLRVIQLTLVADLLGRHAFNVDRKRLDVLSNTTIPRGQTFEQFLASVPNADADTLTGSFGLKATPLGWIEGSPLASLVLFVNFLIPFNDTGYRDNLTPTVGIEWNYRF